MALRPDTKLPDPTEQFIELLNTLSGLGFDDREGLAGESTLENFSDTSERLVYRRISFGTSVHAKGICISHVLQKRSNLDGLAHSR